MKSSILFHNDENIKMVIHTANAPIGFNLEDLGLIPHFAMQGEAWENSFHTAFTEQYGFGNLFEMTGGHVTKTGKYVYRGDPDLFPIATYETENEICYQYDYGIVAIRDKKEINPIFVTRMD